ncbi:MAG: helix-turn-helix domain-containing protein [Syntrophothermus sp.]
MKKIYHLDLVDGNIPVPFLITRFEDYPGEYGGIHEDPHRHNYYSIIWSFSATGKHIIDFISYTIVPGDLFFVNPRQVHQVITDPEPTGMIILFTPEFLQQNSIRENFISGLRLFADRHESPPLKVSDQMDRNLKYFSDEMLRAYRSDDEMKYERIGAYLKLFLIECNASCTLPLETNTQRLEVGRSIVQRFKDLVEKHYHEWHQVKEYAAELNVTPGYLNEVLTASIHCSAKDYISDRLILEAKRIVLFTGNSGKEIGYSLGFEDPAHFSKFFKSSTGLTLQEFRATIPA